MAIQSFLSQTYTNAELLIVDDGEEETPVPNDPRIRYIRLPQWEDPKHRNHRKTRPTGMKRNYCCEFANSEVIVHWDDDDWSAPERIASQFAQLKESGKPLVGYHSISFWDCSARRAYQYRGFAPYACGTSMCYLKSYWQSHKFDPNKWVGEDSDFSTAAKAEGNIASFDGTQMIVARAHSDSTCPPKELGRHSQFPTGAEDQIPAAFRQAIGAL